MKARELKYLFKEGFKNTWVNGIMSLASILTVLACLIMLGIFILFSMNLNTLATDIKGQYEIVAIVNETLSSDDVNSIVTNVQSFDNVKEVKLVTKAEALDELRTDLGDSSDVLSGFEGEKNNPLRNSLHISLKNLGEVSTTVSQIKGISGIVEVKNNQELTDKILKITDIIKMITFWVLFLLVAMTVVIISNTVKVAMFARRKEINIMKFIGATDSFIRIPFIIEGIVISMIGCIAAYLLVINAYSYFYNVFSQNYSYLFSFVPVKNAGVVVGIYFVLLSIIMGASGSVLTIRKYLKV